MMKLTIKDLINYIAIFTVFSGAFSFLYVIPFAELRISYAIMFFISLLIIRFSKRLNFNKDFLLLFLIIATFSLYNVFIARNDFISFIKQFFGILLNSLFFYSLIQFNNYDTKNLFRVYLNLSLIVAIIGIIQEFSYLFRFQAGYDYGYLPHWTLSISTETGLLRINSILPEPSQFCVVMFPAFFASLISLFNKKISFPNIWKSIITIIAFIFSLSTIGYLAIIFSILLLAYNYNKLRTSLASILIIFITIFLLYTLVYEFRLRVDESLKVLTGNIKLADTNLSTFSLYSNALVAFRSFKENPLFGTGLGSYEITFNKYIREIIAPNANIFFLNCQDAGSLFLRLLSETGLFGLTVLFFFIFKFHLTMREDKGGFFWIINNAIFILFFIRLLRSGHYFNDGFFLFFWMYYFSKTHKVKLSDNTQA